MTFLTATRCSRSRPLLRMRPALAVAAGLLLAVTACSRGGDDATSPTSPTTSEPGGGEAGEAPGDGGAGGGAPNGQPAAISPSFSDGTCGFDLPSGTSPRCGTVSVPMDWETGEGEIELAVAVFSSTAGSPATDPIVYLEGGPGGHALETLALGSFLDPLLERGDVVVFDQRGVGLSQPQLRCQEVTELQRVLEDDPDVPDDEADERFFEAISACSSRLQGEGIDLSQFHSVNNAHDVEAVRLALGYDEWNLYGISYGTKLGLEVMRQHPEGVRAAVLDSVFPPQVDSTRDNPGSFLASYEAVVEACSQEPACAAAGDLGERVRQVALDLEADPVQLEVQDFRTGQTDEIYADGHTLVGVVTQALYSPVQFTDLPELVAELEGGETEALQQFLSQDRTLERFFSAGMFYAVECNEEIAFADRDEVADAVPADPFGLSDSFEHASNVGTYAFETCEAFGSQTAPPVVNEAVTSDIPTLLMAGRFDPVTPVAWAEASAANLANSFVVVAPGESHGVSVGKCGTSVVGQFLDDPTSEPDASCFDDPELLFVGAPEREITLEEVTLDYTGVSLATVRPQDWEHGDLPGDSYRQASFLDVTQIVQLVGDPAISFALEAYLFETWGVSIPSAAEQVSVAGRDWQYRSGESSSVAAEWYEIEIDGVSVTVILLSAPEELDYHVTEVLMPALEAIDVS